jgi:biopolymer transport protein ExbB
MADSALDIFVDVWRQGGFVMWFLGPATIFMWLGLGIRTFILRRGVPLFDDRRSLETIVAEVRSGKRKTAWGVIDAAAFQVLGAMDSGRRETARSRVDLALSPLRAQLGTWTAVIRGCALLAPLAGLLGTVTGMISTFDALGTGQMYTSGGGGIGAGVAEALVSTQAGLVIAVPGILLGALLSRKQQALEDEIDRLVEYVSAGGAS